MAAITVTTGKETFPGRSAEVNVTHLPNNQFGGREEGLVMLSRGSNKDISVRRISSASQSAGIGMKPGVVGQWETSTYDVPDGMTLKVWAQNRATTVNMAVAILETRAKAPLYRISIDLTGFARAAMPVLHIEGRFDILTMEQARAAGVIPVPMLTKFITTESKPWFRIQEVAPEIEPKVIRRARVVEDVTGKKVTLTDSRPRRRLAL